jgi:polyhydroxyalkanoate synthase
MPEQVPSLANFRRLKPRPLALHFATAVNTWCGGLAALPSVLDGRFPWHPDVEAEAFRQSNNLDERNASDEAECYRAVAEEALTRLREMTEGILAYQNHPYRRDLSDPPTVWQEGTTRLLDYGPVPGAEDPRLPTVLFVPSLVNRAYILDLSERRSLVRYFAAKGYRPLLVDWDAPGPEERTFTLTDYIDGRLNRMLDRALELAGGPVGLAGYCMGGDLILPVVQRRPADITAAVFLAAPWDFHQDPGLPEQLLPLAASMLKECLSEWYDLNATARGMWRVGGRIVDPGQISVPALVATPGSDRLVRPASARALGAAIPGADMIEPPSGHIGMVVGNRAPQGLWEPLEQWLANRLA